MKITGKIVSNLDTTRGNYKKQTLKLLLTDTEDVILVDVTSYNAYYENSKLYKEGEAIICDVKFTSSIWQDREFQNIKLTTIYEGEKVEIMPSEKEQATVKGIMGNMEKPRPIKPVQEDDNTDLPF